MSAIIDGSAGLTTNSGAVYDGLQLATAQNTTSGTAINFTGIPSWVKRLTVMLNGVSTSGSSNLVVRLGTASGIESTGYYSGVGGVAGVSPFSSSSAETTAFLLQGPNSISLTSGIVNINLVSGNSFIYTFVGADPGSNRIYTYGSGSKTLAGTLTQLRLTTLIGTDTFDAGSVNILYE